MKTLVIHPHDESTDFLKEIYRDKGYTVISRQVPSLDLCNAIKLHDRIIMLGHGSPSGLFGSNFGFVIDGFKASLLQDKHCIGIWCNADQFAEDYKLTGFFTGMFISEVAEALIFDVETTQQDINRSNKMFAEIVREHLDDPQIVARITENYSFTGSDVIAYNHQRMYNILKGEKEQICL